MAVGQNLIANELFGEQKLSRPLRSTRLSTWKALTGSPGVFTHMAVVCEGRCKTTKGKETDAVGEINDFWTRKSFLIVLWTITCFFSLCLGRFVVAVSLLA